MRPIHAVVTFLVFLCFSCVVVSQENTCVKAKRFEFVKEGKKIEFTLLYGCEHIKQPAAEH